MNCSTEMKLQEIDKMLAAQKQLFAMQDNLGMDGRLGDGILVYSLKNLQELSKATGNEIHETGYVADDGWVEVAFKYKETVFNTYLTPDEYKAYKDGDGSGGKDD